SSITATPRSKDNLLQIDDEDRTHRILGTRIKAPKPAKLVLAKKNKMLQELRNHAEALMNADLGADPGGNHHRVRSVGIIVNRVKTARDLAKLLRDDKSKKTPAERREVILLTGRMRAVDRDTVLNQLQPLHSGSASNLETPTFVVATQCLEVGADLDFHALVTECASLD